MKRRLPLLLIVLGILFLISGFGYDVVFAGIPYQDPTPEMSARYAFHSRIASGLSILGGATVLAAAVIGVGRVVGRRFSSPQEC